MGLISTGGQPLTKEQLESANEQAQTEALIRLLKDSDDLCCEECSGLNFMQVIRLKRISGLATGTGKDALIPIPVYSCASCGHVNKMFLAKIDTVKEETPATSPEVPEKGIE